MKYKKTIVIVSILMIFVLLFSLFPYEKHYYKVNNITFTLYIKFGGKCYIMPYEYTGIFAPNQDYIEINKTDNILICIEKDSYFVIFEEQSQTGEPNITYHFNNYKCKIFKEKDYQSNTDYRRNLELLDEYPKIRGYYVGKYPFIEMSLKEMLIYTNGKDGETFMRLKG